MIYLIQKLRKDFNRIKKEEIKKMKLATNKWNVKITINGKSGMPSYYGFKTKREAQAEADRWIQKGFEAEVVKY